MKKLLMLVIAAAIGYAAYTNPDLDAHQQAISDQLPGGQYYSEEQNLARFSDLDYSNFLIASATKDTTKMSMVSYGFLGRVTVVDEDWQPGQAP
ncbi:hypothetical protein Pcar_2482 [Syntrophotalea carbinolica DSM 2380]|uniref:Uncharacterized protein n=1 Tax=Syntrophotalea carbinolica (strain DSM 2380 / NBRC 103641 / GraBd1) TaxID=338963 RepID=Q3A1N6_SYNC1|nr:hypothetical protein [Syntrophotalea carbinolica]ABA89721.2 hypothetical protein Pcar_2482 [Syntrophotalea carbinolica DSM 2380]